MFKHILLPTDGSEFATKAVNQGIEFAKSINARVTTIHVVSEFQVGHDEALAIQAPELKKQFESQARDRAQKMLDEIAERAKAKGVRCATLTVASDLPYQKIIAAAEEQQCDLIMMASHGRRGLASLLLGSETAKVLTHSKIPVLVVR
jgi:nucleotide-binding universal stress UspA family protein